MIKGIGTDLVRLARLQTKDLRFIQRILSDEELNIYSSIQDDNRKLTFLGGRFAAKEALSKAISTSHEAINFRDFVILNDQNGKPYLAKGPQILKNMKVHLSISHTLDHAIAYVILEIT